MLYSEIIAVCSQIHTKHINTLCGQNVEFVNVKLVHIVTTGLWTPNALQIIRVYEWSALLFCLLADSYEEDKASFWYFIVRYASYRFLGKDSSIGNSYEQEHKMTAINDTTSYASASVLPFSVLQEVMVSADRIRSVSSFYVQQFMYNFQPAPYASCSLSEQFENFTSSNCMHLVFVKK
jgi:hypothetical protein